MVYHAKQSEMKTIDPAQLEEVVRRLVAALQPEAIYLYGSHAYGRPIKIVMWTCLLSSVIPQ